MSPNALSAQRPLRFGREALPGTEAPKRSTARRYRQPMIGGLVGGPGVLLAAATPAYR